MPALDPPAPTITPALLDVRAVAALLGVSPRTVTRLAAAGEIPAPLRLGHSRRWSRAALGDWIAAQAAAVEVAR
jgi:excisionase family DNA binding protein